jgi:hypothetical protein
VIEPVTGKGKCLSKRSEVFLPGKTVPIEAEIIAREFFVPWRFAAEQEKNADERKGPKQDLHEPCFLKQRMITLSLRLCPIQRQIISKSGICITSMSVNSRVMGWKCSALHS